MEDILVPIFICALMPVAIVYIVFNAARNSDNRRADVLIKAIESGNIVDADKLAEALRKPQKSARELLNGRLLRACIFTFIGIALLCIGIVNYTQGVAIDIYDDPVRVPLIFGSISLAIGLSYMIVFCFSKRQLDKEKDNNRNAE